LVPQTLVDSSTLFNIRFKLIGNYGDTTAISITDQPLAIEIIDKDYKVVTAQTKAGIITIDPSVTLQGKIFYSNNESIKNVSVNVSGSDSKSTVTNTTGAYSFTIQPSNYTDSYTVVPSKINDPDPLNGIDVLDVATTRRNILQTELFTTPFQTIAADVNESESVSTLDIVLMQALILGIKPGFPNDLQWTFIPATHVFTDALNAFPFPNNKNITAGELETTPSIDFTGVKLGDVNTSRDNSQQGRIAKADDVIFDIRQEKIESENLSEKIISIPVRVKNFNDISAYQFTVSWDKQKLEYVEVTNKGVSPLFGEQKTSEGILTTIWDDQSGKATSFEDGEELFVIKFKSSNGGTYKDVGITSAATVAKVYDKALKLKSHTVTWSELSIEDYSKSFSVYPNPFDKTISIDFYSSEDQQVSYTVTDITGRTIKGQQFKAVKGNNHLEWDGSDLTSFVRSGLYVITLKSSLGEVTVKIVKR
jgi:hypothetical protein